ncbi:MAG: prepilin-type N-terminal cleavage/methylation domain-containing protein [Symploca sp. SIO2D2]|nr:prepilin-type N-terminal cleavage/methylation domain-containing protein [Symploca sp. SIO2D2]
MLNPIKFLLTHQFKSPKAANQNSGFTLIELLVAMIVAALVITPLLGFMINILSTDRREQAKSNSEQEIRTALDYITQDLQQAVYIYNDAGLTDIAGQLPPGNGEVGCADGGADKCQPVLAFWKREIKEDVIPVGADFDDAYVYSLVTYYLVEGNNPANGNTWSDAARIARFEISGEVPDPTNANNILIEADAGFEAFNLGGSGDLETKMGRWTKDANEDYDLNFGSLVLLDYIDKGTPDGNPPAAIGCTGDETRVPDDNAVDSFYACVDSGETYARVYLRGNALARFQPNDSDYNPNRAGSLFPTGIIQVQGSGSLFTR